MKIKNFIIRSISIFFIFLFVLTSFITLPYSTVSAEETKVQYTDASEDLEKADNFNPEVYPLDENNYSLEFIGLSESSKKELFVYVYVPSGNEHNIQATSINISQVHKDVDFSNYSLSLVSKDGVFHKYKVEGLVVKTEPVRYYEISSIFRKFDKLLDGSPFSAQNTISEVVYAVGKSYRLVDVSGDNYDVYVEDIDLITITDRYVGFMRYPDGGWFNIADGVDVHFIAFSTDLRIDSLLEADLVYTSRTFEKSSTTFTTISYGEPKKEKVTVNYKDNMTYDGSGWFSRNYSWPSIERASNFLETEKKGQHNTFLGILDIKTEPNIKSGAKKSIESQDWVIRFCTTIYDFYENGRGDYSKTTSTVISDVSILRLAFETDDVYYNLGVVDVKSTPSENPSNEGVKEDVKLNDDFMDWVKKILAMIAGLGVLVLIVYLISLGWPAISIVFKALWIGIKFLLKIILWLMLFPFNLIGVLFKKIKEKREVHKK